MGATTAGDSCTPLELACESATGYAGPPGLGAAADAIALPSTLMRPFDPRNPSTLLHWALASVEWCVLSSARSACRNSQYVPGNTAGTLHLVR